jgi:hypothetical protein
MTSLQHMGDQSLRTETSMRVGLAMSKARLSLLETRLERVSWLVRRYVAFCHGRYE